MKRATERLRRAWSAILCSLVGHDWRKGVTVTSELVHLRDGETAQLVGVRCRRHAERTFKCRRCPEIQRGGAAPLPKAPPARLGEGCGQPWPNPLGRGYRFIVDGVDYTDQVVFAELTLYPGELPR